MHEYTKLFIMLSMWFFAGMAVVSPYFVTVVGEGMFIHVPLRLSFSAPTPSLTHTNPFSPGPGISTTAFSKSHSLFGSISVTGEAYEHTDDDHHDSRIITPGNITACNRAGCYSLPSGYIWDNALSIQEMGGVVNRYDNR